MFSYAPGWSERQIESLRWLCTSEQLPDGLLTGQQAKAGGTGRRRGWDKWEESEAKSCSVGQHGSPYKQRHLSSSFFDCANKSMKEGRKSRKACSLMVRGEFRVVSGQSTYARNYGSKFTVTYHSITSVNELLQLVATAITDHMIKFFGQQKVHNIFPSTHYSGVLCPKGF